MFGTAITLALLLQIPWVRRNLVAKLESLAEWHERGTADEYGDVKAKTQY